MSHFAILLFAVALLPPAVVLALKRPLIFPFGLYVMLVPYDNLLGITSASLTRGAALITAGALLFEMLTKRCVLAPPRSWLAWTIVIGWATLTQIWTIDAALTNAFLNILIQLLLFFTIVAMYPARREDVRLLGGIIAVSGFVAALYGIYTMHASGSSGRLYVSNSSGFALDPNHYAAAMLLPMALTVGALLETRSFFLRIAGAVSVTAMVYCVFLTGSRGSFIALVVMLAYIGLRTRHRLTILAIGAAIGIVSLAVPTMWNRFTDVTDSSGSGRIFIWQVAGKAFANHWLIGSGEGSFPEAYNRALSTVYQPIFQGYSRPAHNIVLAAIVELGIFGAMALVCAWWLAWRDARGNVVIEAALIGVFIASLFLDTLVFKYVWLALTMAVLVKNVAEPHFIRGATRVAQRSRPLFFRRTPRSVVRTR